MSSTLLVHGAGSDPSVFADWLPLLPNPTCVDLQAGLDVGHASIEDYATAVVRAAVGLPRPLTVIAWSLGGLVALLAAGRVRPERLVLLESSPPREVQGLRAEIEPVPGTFDPRDGPPGVIRRPESSLAMGQRDRGVSVPSLPTGTRTLVVFGDEFRDDRGPALAEWYGAEQLDAGAATHWDMVLDPAVRSRVLAWTSAA
jgi:pimeloyl-ACP methyl ester carboxylesterase